MVSELVRHTRILEIVGDTRRVRAKKVAFGELALIENSDGAKSLARVVGLDKDIVTLQIFEGSKGISTDAKVEFLGHPLEVIYSDNILGRIFRGTGEPLDNGPELSIDSKTGGILIKRTVIICNTSSITVAARKSSIYTGITIGEYYRQMGYNV